jgi:3-oxoacyl-[acyl-carrier protein] reductase
VTLENQVVIVTGGSCGIGRAIALLFAGEGAKVVVATRDEAACEAVAEMVRSRGSEALAVRTDVTDEAQVAQLVDATVRQFGKVDGLVNSAGVGLLASLLDTTTAMWRRSLDVNLTGTFLCCRAVWAPMMKQRRGCILNISSGAAKFPRAGWAAYCASKAGVIALSEALALEGFPFGIRVNVLCPGPTATEMRLGNFPQDDPTLLLTPEDVAKAALFFFTDLSANVYHAQLDVRKRPRGM